jgi:hypothetical protein
MRTPEDLIKVRVMMFSDVDLDRERIIEDPAWAEIADKIDLNDPEQVEQALYLYLGGYIHRQQLFGGSSVFMPSTNGPANITVINMEDITNGDSHGSSN